MNHTLRGASYMALAAGALLMLGCNTSQAAPKNAGLQSQMIGSDDQLNSTEAVANVTPAAGQPSVTVTETLHYLHSPWIGRDTIYSMRANSTATYAPRLGYFVLSDAQGSWFRFDIGSTKGIALPGEPHVSIGAQAQKLAANDPGSLQNVGPGAATGSGRQLYATYNFTHDEGTDVVDYTAGLVVDTTYVADQGAWFAYVDGGGLYRIDSNAKVSYLSEKPYVDRGMLSSPISGRDSTESYPAVTARGNDTFLLTWRHVHDDPFERIGYTTQEVLPGHWVQETHAFMAWVNGNEYEIDPRDNQVVRLDHRPIVDLGARVNSLSGDSLVSTQVFSVTDVNVVVRYTFLHNDEFIAERYNVDLPGVMQFNPNYNVWTVTVGNYNYAITWDSDNFTGTSDITTLRAPAGSTRPQYVVPSNSGDGMPGAVVPGAPSGNAGASNGGGVIPGRVTQPAPSSIPGRTLPGTIPGGSASPCAIPGRC